jgi:hypothetical protein
MTNKTHLDCRDKTQKSYILGYHEYDDFFMNLIPKMYGSQTIFDINYTPVGVDDLCRRGTPMIRRLT